MAKWSFLLALLFFLLPCFADTERLGNIKEDNLAANLKFKDTWNLRLTPYFWYTGLSGHINILGNRAVFSNPWSEIRHDLDFSLGARLEAAHGPWSLLLDPDYVKITQTPAVRGMNSKTTYETTITDTGVFYDLYSPPLMQAGSRHHSLELLGAARIVTFHSTIDFLNGQPPNSTSDTSSFVVPIVGLRLQYRFNPKLQSWFSGDFGGFQISHVSSTWSAIVGLRYNVSDFFDVSLAYKALSVNYSIQAITINTLLQGPILGCGFSW